MAGRRRGRTGRGWDAAPARAYGASHGRAAQRPAEETEAERRVSDAAGAGEAAGTASRARTRTGGRRAGTEPASRDPVGLTRHDPAEPGPGRRAATEPASRDPAERAREICLRQLAVRPRTRAELATALRRHGIAEPVVAQVLDRYHEVGMIDDAAFARAWVASRHHGQGLARRALGSELRQRGVAAEAVGEALGELDPETEAATARALVDRKLRSTTGSPQAVVRRLVGMLARRGYPASLAFRVVKEALAADARTAEIADELDPDALSAGVEPDPLSAGVEPEPLSAGVGPDPPTARGGT